VQWLYFLSFLDHWPEVWCKAEHSEQQNISFTHLRSTYLSKFMTKFHTTISSPRFSHLPIWQKIWKKGNGWRWFEVSKSPHRLPFIVNKNHSEPRGKKGHQAPKYLRCTQEGHTAKDCNHDPPIRWALPQKVIKEQLPIVASRLRLEEIILEDVSFLHRNVLRLGVHQYRKPHSDRRGRAVPVVIVRGSSSAAEKKHHRPR